MLRAAIVLFAATVLVPASSEAQQFEVGIGLSTVCRGSDGSVCSGDRAAPLAAHISGLFSNRYELGLRVARGSLDDRSFTITGNGDVRFDPAGPDRVTVFTEGRSIQYLTGHALYHFRRGNRVRPMLGLGIGSLRLPRTNRCEPAGCEATMRRLLAPAEATSHSDIVITAGVSVRATERLVLRGGWQAHNFAAEELSSVEWFLAAGWRFGFS